jgi:hypothetical protein
MARVVMPSVRLFFPCEQAVLEFDDDGEDGRWVLTRPLHSATLPADVTENFMQHEIWFYAQLIGGIGKFKMSVALSTEDGYWLRKSETEAVDFLRADHLAVYEAVFRMTDIVFPRPGFYEFKLLANHVELPGGSASFTIFTE